LSALPGALPHAQSMGATDTGSLEQLSRHVAERLVDRLDSLAESMVVRLDESVEVQDLMRPEWRDATFEIARQNLKAELEALLDGAQLPISCPKQASDAARAAVAFGSSPVVIGFCFRTGHAILWDAWSTFVEELDCDQEERRSLLEMGSEFMFSYADRCTYFAELEFAREHERVVASRERERRETVLRVIEGLDERGDALDYDLDQHHLGAIAHGTDVGSVLSSLGEQLGSEVLTVPSEHPDTRWVWFGRAEEFGAEDQGVFRRLKPPPAARLSVGIGGDGVEGFRNTHLQAVLADRVGARVHASPVTTYEDAGLEGLALADPAGVRAFVETELRGLDGDDQRTEILRETLAAYFASAQNASSTAAGIYVSERTIANRLHSIERRLGRSVVSRRAELETALRLREIIRNDAEEPPVIQP
jgi:hypothetical protein